MSIQWPASIDDLNALESGPSLFTKATVLAIMTKLQRMLNAQPNASPVAGGTVTPDMSLGWRLLVFLPAGVNTVTIANPSNAQEGDWLIVYTLQNSTGTGLVAWGANFRKTASLSIPAAIASSLDTIAFNYSAAAVKWNQVAAPLLGMI
jgi:hypothetical protein